MSYQQPMRYEPKYERERYEPKKFDYQYDDRFHRQVKGQQRYEEHHSPRHDQMYQDRSPRRHEEMMYHDRSPRHHEGMYQDRSPRYDDMYDHRGRHDERSYDANKGYLVMMRFRQSDLSEVVNAIQENLSTLGAHNGYVIGFAEPEDMEILISSNQAMASDQWWDPRPTYDGRQRSRYAVCCFWFKDAKEAKRWFESAKRIKQPEFPNSNPYQAVIVPMTYGSNREPLPFGPASNGVTLLWSEYPHIFERNRDDFRKNYSDQAWDCMKAYGAFPNVAVSRYVAGWESEPQKYGQPQYLRQNVQPQRYARAISTGWVQPNTFIAVSAFPTRRSLLDFYHSPFHQQLRYRLDKYSDPVFIAITLSKVNGTSR